MFYKEKMILAVKSAPIERIFSSIKSSNINAVEIYLSKAILKQFSSIVKLTRKFPFRYALHAPNDSYEPKKLAELAGAIQAEVIVFHDIFWDDEWDKVAKIFKNIKSKVCIENIASVYEAAKFARRYGFGWCLDLEHLQVECGGVFEEEFINAIKRSAHIHLTGYSFGSELWHTHLHNNPKHSSYMLGLLRKADYSGFIVSEARTCLQTAVEFKKLNNFYRKYYGNAE